MTEELVANKNSKSNSLNEIFIIKIRERKRYSWTDFDWLLDRWLFAIDQLQEIRITIRQKRRPLDPYRWADKAGGKSL